MSAGTTSNTEILLYVRLRDEDAPQYTGLFGVTLVGSELVRLVATEGYDLEDEHWEFLPGTVVRYEKRVLGGSEVLVATEQAAE